MNARPAAGLCAVLLCTGIAAGNIAAQRPSGFQRVLWVDAAAAGDAALLARVRAAGFDAINLGPAGDPAPLRAAGLGFYLDQPVGKGFLELRDAEFEPLRSAYERTRDPAGLVRPQCLRDPARLQELGARAAAATARLRGPELRFVALADEASATRHNNPLDLCRCAVCVAAFRQFLRGEYQDIQGLDAAWGTDFGDFDQVVPLTTDQVRRRELGGLLLPANLRPWSDWLRFVDLGFAAAVAHLHEQVRRTAPDVPVGLTGLQPPVAFGGHDYALLLPPLTLVEPYDIGAAPVLARSLLPRAERWFTLTLPARDFAPLDSFEAQATARLCAAAANGGAGVVVWNHAAMFAGEAPSQAGKALQRAMARLQVPLDACAGAAVRPADVWIVESQPSVRAWWMLDSTADGLTWVRRLASHEARHSTSLAARRAWVELLSDLGITAQFVASEQMPERLLQQRPRLLVLPATIALADRACRAITAYVQQGGTVLADHSAALYDDGLKLRPAGGLDALFGIEARSLRWDDLGVREGRCRGAEGVAESGLRAGLAERSGDQPVFLERRHGRGRAVYLNLAVCDYAEQRHDAAAVRTAVDLRRRVRQVLAAAELSPPFDVRGEGLPTCIERTLLVARDGRHVLAVRIDALASPPLLLQLVRGGPRPVRLSFPRPVQLRSLSGDDLGSGTEFDLKLDPSAGLFVVQQ